MKLVGLAGRSHAQELLALRKDTWSADSHPSQGNTPCDGKGGAGSLGQRRRSARITQPHHAPPATPRCQGKH